jgi:hypothetical protein
MIDRKKMRDVVGYTRAEQAVSAEAWFRVANSFHAAAQLLSEFSERVPADSRPFALNAALSLELVFKAILAKRCEPIPETAGGHDLVRLCKDTSVELNTHQQATLELLTETIVWAGRYPTPKKDEHWDDYHDRIFEKHVIRSQHGNVSQVMANPESFPDWDNYQKIWNSCVLSFESISPSGEQS